MSVNKMVINRHDLTRLAVLNALKASDQPMTVGELFLVTKYSHPTILAVLREFRNEKVTASEIRKSRTVIYSGQIVESNASHWWVVKPKKKKIS